MVYHDTDSYMLTTAEKLYVENDVSATKDYINSLHGIMNGKAVMMNNDYIVVHRNRKAVVIFQKYIVAVEMDDDNTAIISTVNGTFYTDEKYADVVKRIM